MTQLVTTDMVVTKNIKGEFVIYYFHDLSKK